MSVRLEVMPGADSSQVKGDMTLMAEPLKLGAIRNL